MKHLAKLNQVIDVLATTIILWDLTDKLVMLASDPEVQSELRVIRNGISGLMEVVAEKTK